MSPVSKKQKKVQRPNESKTKDNKEPQELKQEIKPQVKPEVKPELKQEVKPEVKAEVKPELKQELMEEAKPELKQELKQELKPELKQELKPELKKELKPELKPELKAEVQKEQSKLPNDQIQAHEPTENEKVLRAENEGLKAELKELEDSLAALQTEFNKSCRMRERLDSLSKVLESRTNEIKAESHAKMQAAEDQSMEIAQEVTTNMGYMQNINQSLSTVTNESVLARKENEGLAEQVSDLKKRYDEREKLIQDELQEAHNGLIAAQTELAKTKLRNAEDKEKFFAEMQKVASGLVQSKQEMKEAKETELGLRILLKKYDDKFGGLQAALQETNSSYDHFREEMDKMGARTKELEKEAIQWQQRWEESNNNLLEMTKNHEVLQRDLQQIHDKLLRMTNLCKALQKENSELEKKLPQPTAK